MDLHCYVKCPSSTSVFHAFASVNQLTGFSIKGKLAGCAYMLSWCGILINYRLLNVICKKDACRKRI